MNNLIVKTLSSSASSTIRRSQPLTTVVFEKLNSNFYVQTLTFNTYKEGGIRKIYIKSYAKPSYRKLDVVNF